MGTSSSPQELAAKLTRMGTQGVPTALRVGIEAASLETKIHAQGVMAAHGLPVGGGWRNMGGAKYGVRYKVMGKTNPTSMLWIYGGPAYITEYGVNKSWKIDTTKRNRRRRNKARSVARKAGLDAGSAEYETKSALRTPYGPRRSVIHPPLAAKPYWHEVMAYSRVTAPRTIAKATSVEMVKQFAK